MGLHPVVRIGVTFAMLVVLQTADAGAQEASVVAIRPQGIVVDAAALEDLKPGVKVGFVRDGDERREIAQGWVLELKDGKALVGVAPGTGVKLKKGDLVVVCPAAGEDPHGELRAKLEEIGDTPPPAKGRKPSRVQQVVQQVTEALEARDAASEEGKCDLGAHDEQIEALGDQLSKLAVSRPPARREVSRAPAKSRSPAKKPVEEEEAAEEPAEESADADTARAEREPDEATPSARDAGGDDTAAAREGKQPPPVLQKAIDAVLKLIESGSQKSGKRDRKRAEDSESTPAEPPSEPEPVVRAVVQPSVPAEAPPSGSATEETPKTAPPATSGPSTSSPAGPSRAGGGPMTDPLPPTRRGGGAVADPAAPPPSTGGASTAQGGTAPAPSTDRRTDRGQRIRVPVDRTAPSKETPATTTSREPSKETPATTAPREPTEGRPPRGKFPDRVAKVPTPSKEEPRTATISGRVVSDKGDPVAGARVAIVGAASKATTTGQGTFELKNLTPGGYKVVVSAPGFNAETRAITLAAGKSESITFSLKAGADRPGATPGLKRPRKFGGDADE